MPHGDGTGPMGAGSMTGRALGYCAGYAQPGFANVGPGFVGVGRGAGFGRAGRGYRNRYHATGLAGWQRAERGMQAWGRAPVVAETMPAAAGTASAVDDLQTQAERLEHELGRVREALLRLQAE